MEAYFKQPDQEDNFEKKKREFLNWSKRKLNEMADEGRAEFETYPFDVVKDKNGTEYLEKSELSVGQRRMLSNALAMIGVLTMQTPDKDGGRSPIETEQSTQNNGGDQGDDNRIRIPIPALPLSVEREATPEISAEQFEESPEFFNEVSGYLARTQLRFDEVIFVDEHNRPIGEPVKLESFTVTRDGESHLVTPGPMNEYGILTDGIAGEWLEYKRAQLARENPDAEQFRVLSVASHFEAALQTSDEPELVAAIKSGRIATYIELVRYYMDKEVVGGGGLTRMEYIQQHISFDEDIPQVAQDIFKEIAIGIVFQESGGSNGLVSRTGARGAWQFQPTTWEGDLHKKPEDIASFTEQVDAAGKYLSMLYRQVQHFIGKEAIIVTDSNGRRRVTGFNRSEEGERVLSVLQNSMSEEEFIEFMAYAAVQAYNQGASRVAAGIRESVMNNNLRPLSADGRDSFIRAARFSEESNEGLLYESGPDGREYVQRAMAGAIALNAQPKTRVSVGFDF